jgi:ABC-type Fe3+-hydroxamate transport system substrate-binding protein
VIPVDGRGVRVALNVAPQRIVSLVPSTTETLFDLGLGDRVVGVTRYCVHPARVRALPRVGGTKDVRPDRVRALAPDLIVGNCEENTREIFDALADVAPLWAPLPRTVDDALADLLTLGALCGVPDAAAAWHTRILAARAALRASGRPPTRVAWLIWRRPWMTINRDTFIDAMLREANGVNVFADHPDRFPVITAAQIAAHAPDLVLLSSEPYPFQGRHVDELAKSTGLPRDRIRGADGELASWHGTRMALAFDRWTREDWPALS